MSDVWRNDKNIKELKVRVDTLTQAVSNIEKFLEIWDYKQEAKTHSKSKKESNDVLQHNETTGKESHQSKR